MRVNAGNVFGTAHRFRISRLLVVGQIALAVVVITAAGVMLRSLARLAGTNPGFRAAQTMTAQLSLNRGPVRDDCAQKGTCLAFFENLLDRTQSLPGVQAAALVDRLPMTGRDDWFNFDAEGHPRTPRERGFESSGRIASASYFNLMGIHLLRGRLFNASDYAGTTRAAIINAAEANQLWPNQDPIGKHVEYVVDEPSPALLIPTWPTSWLEW